MFSSKKGDITADNLVTILLILVGAIVILSVIFVFFTEEDDAYSRWICKASVYISDQTGGMGQRLPLIPSGIICKTVYKQIGGKDQTELMEKMAGEMRKCWNMWGEGDWEPSPNWFKWNQRKCFVCYKFDVGEKVPSVSLNEFIDYLQGTENKKLKDTYWNYFRGIGEKAIFFNFPSVGNDLDKNIFENKEGFYAVVYVNDVTTSWGGAILEGMAVGSVIGVKVGVGACTLTGPLGMIACGAIGGGIGGTLGGIGAGIYKVVDEALVGPKQGIMLSEFEAIEDKCNVRIE